VLQSGQSLDHFRERLSLCGTLSRLAHAMGKASLVHWTTSDQLPQGDVFDKLAAGEIPNLLHVHPLLSNGGKSADGRDQTIIATFGDEDRSLSCRVRHLPEGAGSGTLDGPLYRLELLFSRKHGFTSTGYVAPVQTFDDRTVPADILSDLGRGRSRVVEDIRAKRQMVERLGGHLEVSETAPPPGAWGLPRAFGRKKPQGDA